MMIRRSISTLNESSARRENTTVWRSKTQMAVGEAQLGKKVAKALEQGYSAGQPYHGYYFKVLKG